MLELAPLRAPEGASTPNCLWTSRQGDQYTSPWRLTRFLWQATTVKTTYYFQGAERPYDLAQPSPFNRTLQVELKNMANNFTASCVFNDNFLDGETDKWWPCFRDRASQDEHMRPLQRSIETWVQFSAKTGQLVLNQTWYCLSDGPAATAYKITAQGRTPVSRAGRLGTLVCGQGSNTWSGAPCPLVIFGPVAETCDYTYVAKWCTLGDRDGRITCGPDYLPVLTENLNITSLPPGDLTEPEPTPEVWSCTVASLGRGPVVWTLQQLTEWVDFFAQTDWFGVLSTKTDVLSTWFRFNLNSSVFVGFPPTALSGDGVIRELGVWQEGNGWSMSPWMRTFDPGRVITDRTESPDYSNPGWRFYNAMAWSLRLDISTGHMELNHSWYCDDENPERPIVFNGVWNGYLPLVCEYAFPGPRTGEITRQGVTCRFAEGKQEVRGTPTVTHVVSPTKIPYRVPHW